MNKLVKRTVAGLTGLGAIGGATAVAVSCGASTPIYDYKIYYADFVKDNVKVLNKGKNIRLWLPFKQAYSADNTNYKIGQTIKGLLETAGYSVTVIDSTTFGSYSKAPTEFEHLAKDDPTLLPDVVVNYPDVQGLAATHGLAEEFEQAAADNVTDALKYDVTSVLAEKQGNYALPLLKSSELTYFNVVAFAMLLKDIAATKTAAETITFPSNSPQSRMAKMILAASGDATVDTKKIYENETIPKAYTWPSFTTAWTTLSNATTGLWKDDFAVLNSKFKLTSPPALNDVDLSKEIFNTYTGVAAYVKALAKAYTFTSSDTGILGVDSPTNVVYSYQYDVAGHTPDNFVVRADNTAGTNRIAFDYRDSIGTDAAGKPITSPTFQAVSYLADLANTGALQVKDNRLASPPYMTGYLKNHQLFMAWESNSGTGRVLGTDANALNAGQVYYDLQPTKAGIAGEVDKNTIINQGPSIFVTKVNENSAAIAKLLGDAMKPGGAFTAKFAANSNQDTGLLSESGYFYANKQDNAAGSQYRLGLAEAIQSYGNWATSIGKYLVSNYYSLAAADVTKAKYDAYANPAGKGTSLARTTLENQFVIGIVNKSIGDAASIVQATLRTIVPDGRLY